MSLARWNDNSILVNNLRKTIKEGKLSHAIIVEGDFCVDKMAFAKDLVKAVICKVSHGDGCDECITCNKVNGNNYEDLFILDKEGPSIRDEYIEEMQEFLKRKASLDLGKFAIVNRADLLTPKAQNRLLKTLEEPTKNTFIILLSENIENFLDTVKSRCVIYRINSGDAIIDNQVLEMAETVVEMLQGEEYFHEIKKLTEKILKEKDKKAVAELLDGMESIYRNYLFDLSKSSKLYRKEDVFKYIRYIEEAKKDLRFNVSPSYAFKNLIIKIGG